jgi:hypothetical protein
VLRFKIYEYNFLFNYSNIEVKRVYHGSEKHGMALFLIKQTAIHKQSPMPANSIVTRKNEPIVRVVMIGSAYTLPGYVTLEADPIRGERRDGETIRAVPIRFRADNLWRMHLRSDLLTTEPEVTYEHLPVAGMSYEIFEMPKSKDHSNQRRINSSRLERRQLSR